MGRPRGLPVSMSDVMYRRAQWAKTRAEASVRLAQLRQKYSEDEPRDEGGRWTDGGGSDGGGGSSTGGGGKFTSASPEKFIAGRNQSTRQGYMSPLKPEDLSDHTLITTKDSKAGVAIDPQGDLQNLFNNGGPKGIGADLVTQAIGKGARTLDCYDGHLPDYYHQFGFVETGRMKFDPAYAHNWDVNKQGTPDVVFMAWKGYLEGGEKGALDRAKGSKDNWVRNVESSNYTTDYDKAKDESRVAARREKNRRLSGGEQRTPADRAGNPRLARTGERSRRPLIQRRVDWAVARSHSAALLRDFDPDQPRDDDGKWTSGGGGGGDGGGEAKPASDKPSSSSGKGGGKKPAAADFTKDGVYLDSNTMNNPDAQKKFLETWEKNVGEAPAAFKHEFLGGMPGSMNIRFHDNLDAITVSGSLHDEQGNSIGDYTRDIDLDDHRAVSSYFKLDREQTGKNVGKQLLAANVDMYQKMGVEQVSVHANIDVGGYAWAKYGYVPTADSWRDLSDEIDTNINRMAEGGGGGGYDRASSWEEMSEGQQQQIERAFMRETDEEFMSSEVESWRGSGQPLDAAKEELANDFGPRSDWADSAIDGYRKTLEDKGKADIPFSNEQLLAAISVEYKPDGEGGGDFTVDYDDDKLTQPQGVDPSQPTLPGIEPVLPHEHLTEDMRKGLTRAIEKSFDNEASEKEGDVEPPDYLAESARESQRDYWDSMDDSDKYDWAKRNEPDLLGGPLDELVAGTGEMSEDDARRLRALTASRDPKAIWTIADSKYGKQLLLGTDWTGTLNLKDKETMDRFKAYVGKASSKAA